MDFFEMMQEVMRRQQNILRYEIAEGFAFINEQGNMQGTTPEMLEVTEDIFIGLEDVVAEILQEFGVQS